MNDVAKRAGVSIATVSAVVNRSSYVSPVLTKRVKQAIVELDYSVNHIARSLQTRASHTIGMLIPSFASPDPFFGQVVEGAEAVLMRKGYCLIIGQTHNQASEQDRYLEVFRSRMVDGLLIFLSPGDVPVLKKMVEQRHPVVFLGRLPEFEADAVASDIALGTEMAVSYLISRGHQRIGLVTVGPSLSVAAGRLDGWRRALKRGKLPADEEYHYAGALSSATGMKAAEVLLSLPKPPSAIFADDLVLATGIIQTLIERGLRCPEDVEVVSSDDAEWLNAFRPPVSTVVQPSQEIGRLGAEMLLRRMRNPRRAFERVLLPPGLRIRR
ncbi:MAG TPA: LacI family DNA-binding transcriptional regulator [Bryobacteraceae bacterium]|nr:LacI family DNA-binding transcriptional regulator [Bryobacteraceae bacterium]